MKIKDVIPYLRTPATESQKTGKEDRVSRSEAQTEKVPSVSSDRVELQGSQIIEKARTRAREMPEVREEKVEAIRRRIEAGNYNVPPEEVARSMLSDLLKDIF